MQTYLVEDKQMADLYTAYPHSPADPAASIQDYLEDRLSGGFALVSMSSREGSANEQIFIFKVVAK